MKDWHISKLTFADYLVLFTGVIALGMLISLGMTRTKSQEVNRMYNNKEDKDPNYLRAYEESKEVRENKINEFIKAAQGEQEND